MRGGLLCAKPNTNPDPDSSPKPNPDPESNPDPNPETNPNPHPNPNPDQGRRATPPDTTPTSSLRLGPTGASRAQTSAAHLSSYDGRRCLGLRSWHMTR